ncbi:MAG: ATP synthase F1, gamma subunit [Candidatus Giovannonibacteria bacterium GW2011_GWA2_44_13b]|uniref:ATP synthase gamma chain n=2 Tax=Candidatus Giovannoniibacteriota TaxID=1752738 RepID=A0A0G1GXH2_9BACT|nr:MAG: ATP synthase F1, gamma subunit [Candidatus Giovannonibacteria bacterium GW2011_GWA2_44_13b]OGF81429.1 MAG: ATP synthase F1 subunit gamma [Candidatus Giovannonibacteria bacterium RIFCSPLOWO2_01_FULL_44_16]
MAESLQNIKSRLGAVKNIGQITKAMEVVSATKMRKSQETALGSRPYAFFALELLEKLLKNEDLLPPGKKSDFPGKSDFEEGGLMAVREIKKTLVVVVASDRGLAGSFNSQIFRAVDVLLAKDNFAGEPAHEFVFAAVGKKAENYVLKNKWTLLAKFQGFGDFIETMEVSPLAEFLTEGYLKGKFDRVLVASTHFRTALFQEVLTRQILPFDLRDIEKTVKEIVPERGRYADLGARLPIGGRAPFDYILEPTPAEILNSLIPHLFKMQVYHIILEANASEHSARRVAMKSAADNADEISTNLSISYNKVRQASITSELIEITGTQSALA